tara:strand:+ start:1600 stop:1836 length:237 start_codon:yes stop_codon:yes gene_type:complete
MQPIFINLTGLDGTPITINISKIVCYEPRFTSSKTDSDTIIPYTYIVLSGGHTVTRQVRKTYEEFVEMMNFLTINNND